MLPGLVRSTRLRVREVMSSARSCELELIYAIIRALGVNFSDPPASGSKILANSMHAHWPYRDNSAR